MSENRSIDDPFEASEILYADDALEDIDKFAVLVKEYIVFYSAKVAHNRLKEFHEKNKNLSVNSDVIVSRGDVMETIDCLSYMFGKEFFEFTGRK